MELNPARCAKCDADLGQDRKVGLTYCSACGQGLPMAAQAQDHTLSPAVSPKETHERLRWRICFWLFFLLTPFAALLLGSSRSWLPNLLPPAAYKFLSVVAPLPLSVLGTVIAGALSAGYCLAKLHTKAKTKPGILLASMLIGLGLIGVYLTIIFFGCIAVMSGARL